MGAHASRPADAPPAAAAPSVPPPHRDFDTLVREELALQAAAIPPAEVPSCLTLFDKWLACYAIGVQFKNAHRYGEIANCAPRKEDFKFCLTLRSLDPDARRHAYLLRRAEEMAHRRRGFRTSEAVWEMRREPLLDPDFVDPAYPVPSN